MVLWWASSILFTPCFWTIILKYKKRYWGNCTPSHQQMSPRTCILSCRGRATFYLILWFFIYWFRLLNCGDFFNSKNKIVCFVWSGTWEECEKGVSVGRMVVHFMCSESPRVLATVAKWDPNISPHFAAFSYSWKTEKITSRWDVFIVSSEFKLSHLQSRTCYWQRVPLV